jgi:hypothetical protein
LSRCIRANHYSLRTERAYVYWARWYIRFHGEQIAQSKLAYEEDRLHQRTGVMMPNALELKYPSAGMQWEWFWVFPSDHESIDPRSGIVRRHHIYEQSIQRAVKRAVMAAKLTKLLAAPFGIVLQLICWKQVTTFALCKNYWDMPMCRRR